MSNSIHTRRFGAVEYDDEKDVLFFEDGLPGFEQYRRWVLIGGENEPLKWLQSLVDGDLALPVASPFSIDPEYTIAIPSDDAEAIDHDCAAPERTGVLVVVTIPLETPWEATANMIAPIVVNMNTRRARQILVDDERYSVWYPLLKQPAREKLAKTAGSGA